MQVLAVLHSVIALAAVSKRFGAVTALDGVSLEVPSGSCIGLVGHNGAGKSTLMQILAGTLAADEGQVQQDGKTLASYGVAAAQALGVRCVYQELSLCPNLSVADNTRVRHVPLKGRGWRTHAERLILSMLDDIFPDHGISGRYTVADLSLARRQMVEIACAFTVTDIPAHLVILDEPTSSLDSVVADQLLAFVRRFVAKGGSCILISHRLGEILNTAGHIVVMRDGRIACARDAGDFTRESLVHAMGSVVSSPPDISTTPTTLNRHQSLPRQSGSTPRISADFAGNRQRRTPEPGIRLEGWPGEVVALAGLEGQGQPQMLAHLFACAQAVGNKRSTTQIDGRASLVTGDRLGGGVFPLWSISENISIGSQRERSRHGFIDRRADEALAEDWSKRMAIRTPNIQHPILSLSGGNQQKALFARALACNTDIVLMDDPMRGVDVETKREVYEMIRHEASIGRCFIWYTTELEELLQADHVYVFRNQSIVADFARGDLSERQVLDASFEPT